jgi:hypothetical protein
MKKLVTITKKSFMFYISMIAVIGLLWTCSEEEDPVILPPTIKAITPDNAMEGQAVTIIGANFSSTAVLNEVSFNGIAATVIATNTMAIATTVPVGATTGNVTVTTNNLTSAGVMFTVRVPVIPTITSIDPTSGAIGDPVTITGTNFSTTPVDNVVSFNGGAAIVTASTATTITTTVPASAVTGNVTVTVDNQTSNGVMFTFTGVPVNTLSRHISTDADDAEEGSNNGKLTITSSDLELGEYDTWTQDGIEQGLQTIGIKFDTITIPASAVIVEAYIQFTADNTGADPVQLTIYGENSSYPEIYDEAIFYHITSRERTTASAVWDVPEWPNVGDAGDAQKTVDLASIVQEIVNRGDWASGNSMAFIMEHSGPSIGVTSSSGGREAEAGPGDDSAELTIIYE